MAVRAMWKGVIRVGDESVPVKVYSAVESSSVHFRLLHETDGVPVKQRLVNPKTGDPVEHSDTRRGYVTDDGRIVVLDPDDLDELEPEASRDIEVLRFVPAGTIGHEWYERPYWLGPDEDDEAYAALAAALEERGREGVARWVMRKKRYQGALRLEQGRLMMVTLRHPEEVVAAGELPAPSGREPEKAELDMASRLLEALHGTFDPADFPDEYRERVMELIEAKAEGKTVPIAEAREKPETDDLTDALERSLAAAKERKSA